MDFQYSNPSSWWAMLLPWSFQISNSSGMDHCLLVFSPHLHIFFNYKLHHLRSFQLVFSIQLVHNQLKGIWCNNRQVFCFIRQCNRVILNAFYCIPCSHWASTNSSHSSFHHQKLWLHQSFNTMKILKGKDFILFFWKFEIWNWLHQINRLSKSWDMP